MADDVEIARDDLCAFGYWKGQGLMNSEWPMMSK